MRWRALAPGKVNLCLFLGEKRPDGRHELVTLYDAVSLADELELTERDGDGDEVICRGVDGPNLVEAALSGLRARGWPGPPVCVRVSKWIPVAGGMAGGSADAAAMIRLADAVAPVDPHDGMRLATDLGADVPSQLEPGLALGLGAGEIVTPAGPLAQHAYVVVPLSAELSTAQVFARADELGLARDAADLAQRRSEVQLALQAGGRWPQALTVNDLQVAACDLCPAIEPALAAASKTGADAAFVSGSGPTVIAVFWGEEARARAEDAEAELAARYPEAYAADPVTAAFGTPQRV